MPIFWVLLGLYLFSECLFYVYFHTHLIHHANALPTDFPTAKIYQDYPEPADRVKLLRRILQRLCRKAQMRNQTVQQVISEFILAWYDDTTTSPTKSNFSYQKSRSTSISLASSDLTQQMENSNTSSSVESKPLLHAVSNSSSEASSLAGSEASSSLSLNGELDMDDRSSVPQSQESSEQKHASWTIPGLHHKSVYDSLAWAFFAKDSKHLTMAEQAALQDCFACLQQETGLVFASQSNHYQPRRLSLEPVRALHRPWIVYALIGVAQWAARFLILPALGFVRVTAVSVPLVAWHRPRRRNRSNDNSNNSHARLFFHGIAPSGILPYLPMLQAVWGKTSDDSDILLFENPSVSCQFHALPQFHVASEVETVQGIREILQHTQLAHAKLTLMGHSFGSCPITWILRQQRQHAYFDIEHVILLDPVTILLSEPTVMSRFLYSDKDAIIRFVVASELFTEFYLRRHFCWYNSELWLEDFQDLSWTIVLSGCDEIVPSPVVQEHVQSLALPKCELVYWPHAKHANCVMSPFRWKLMQDFLPQSTANCNPLRTKQD